jgi:hypothetical protein
VSSDSAINPAASAQRLTAVASAFAAGVGTLLVNVAGIAASEGGTGFERLVPILLVGVLGMAAVGAVCGLLGGVRAAKTGAYLGGLAGVFVALLALGWVAPFGLILWPLAVFSIGCGLGSVIGYAIAR